MIRTHIRIAHIASILTESPVDSRQCDWGINERRLRVSEITNHVELSLTRKPKNQSSPMFYNA